MGERKKTALFSHVVFGLHICPSFEEKNHHLQTVVISSHHQRVITVLIEYDICFVREICLMEEIIT